MKYITGQKHCGYVGQTTFALDSVEEANSLIHEFLGSPEKLSKSIKDYRGIVNANPNYNGLKKYNMKDDLKVALLEIENGNPTIEAEVEKYAREFEEYAKDVEPSLTQEQTYSPSEEGEVFDAGKIASDDPMAFFAHANNMRPKSGKGDGAFRIVINTDVAWYGDPTRQCGALMAIVNLLQRQAPVEIWVQQGWMGNTKNSGITLFKVFSGGQILTKHLYFWIGSPYKDSPYSFVVNRMLGRQDNGVSLDPEIPCDLYIYPTYMPPLKSGDDFKTWVTHTSKAMLFEEELPDNWTGYNTTRPEVD